MFSKKQRSLLMVGSGVAFLLVIFVSGLFLIPKFQASTPSELQKSDADEIPVDGMYVNVIPVLPGMAEDMNLDDYVDRSDYEKKMPFLISLNTHTGNIKDIRINTDQSQALLYGPDHQAYPALEQPMALSTHHNSYLMFFPSKNMEGESFLDMESGYLALRVKSLGQKQTRAFKWELPLKSPSAISLSLANWIMVGVAIAGAMLIVLSPCAIELTVYYSGIVGAVLSEYGRETSGQTTGESMALTRQARWVLVENLLAFTLGFTALYGLSGAMVGLIGDGVKQPLGEYETIIAYLGGGLIVYFGLNLLGFLPLSWLNTLSARLTNRMKKLFTPESYRARKFSEGNRSVSNVNGLNSFLAGIGLSSGCLTCMGGAVLYPLLVYAGVASWYWGMITLTLYSILIAVPMMFIALGSADWMSTLGRREKFARQLKYVSGSLLMLVGVMILVGYERWITDAFFTSLGQVVRIVS